MSNLLDYIKSEAKGGVCPLRDSLAFLDVIDNWVHDRALNLVFMNLPIGSHEWLLAALETWHNLDSTGQAQDWLDVIPESENWAALANNWLGNSRGFYLSSCADTLWPKKLTTIERRMLKHLKCAEGL